MSALPLAIVLGVNARALPIPTSLVMRILAAGFALTAVLLAALRLPGWGLAARATWLSVVFLLFTFYGPLVEALHKVGAPVAPHHWRAAAVYGLVTLAVASLIVRPWRVRPRDPMPLLVIAAAFLGANLLRSFEFAAAFRAWRPLADAVVESAQRGPVAAPASARRDIYYVVLDAFGRADTLQEYYDLDLTPFVAFLRTRGFYVADSAQSNYAQTFLSLASTLNLNYIDEVGAAAGRGEGNRRPMADLIARNALMKLARRSGYRVIGIGSDYVATTRLDGADVCICELYGLEEIEQTTLTLTPFGPLLGNRPFEAHRRKVISSFDAIERVRSTPGRKLVFAHIVSPHPPFVFGPDGSPRQPDTGTDIFNDGDDFTGTRDEYRSGYHDQAQFVVRRLMALVDSLLDGPGPAPVIVLHGDHGPGSMLRWEDPEATDMRERLSIFAAYYFPDGPPLYPTITPINGARALARGYLGAALPFLPDRSAFSTWSRPYDLIQIGQLPRPD